MRKALIIVLLVLVAVGIVTWIKLSSRSNALPLQSQIEEIDDTLGAAATQAELAKLPRVGVVQIAGGRYTVYYDKTWPRVFIRGTTNMGVHLKVFRNSFDPLSRIGRKVGIAQSRGIGIHLRRSRPDMIGLRIGVASSSGIISWEMSYQAEAPSAGPRRSLYLKRIRLRKDFEKECSRVTHPPFKIAGKSYPVTSDTSYRFYLVDLQGAKEPSSDFSIQADNYVRGIAAKHGVGRWSSSTHIINPGAG